MSRSFLSGTAPPVGLDFTVRRPWFMDRTTGAPLLPGELAVIDLAHRSVHTTNRIFGDPNSCWVNIVRAVDFEDMDNAPYVLVAEAPRDDGRVRCYVWGNEVPIIVRNYAGDTPDPTPIGRPLAAPHAAASPYLHDMRHAYCSGFQNDASIVPLVLGTPPTTSPGRYTSLIRYIGLLGTPLAKGTTELVRSTFNGWEGFGQSGEIGG